jgi:Protein of unknown function (DUF3253)
MPSSLDPVIAHLNDLLDSRSFPKTICPSEAARALSATELQSKGVDKWRDLMPTIHELAFELREKGELEILQKGEMLPESQTMEQTVGPVRLRRKAKS